MKCKVYKGKFLYKSYMRRNPKIRIRTSVTAWIFVLALLLLGSFMLYTGIEQDISHIMIGSGIILGGFKVLKQHW